MPPTSKCPLAHYVPHYRRVEGQIFFGGQIPLASGVSVGVKLLVRSVT